MEMRVEHLYLNMFNDHLANYVQHMVSDQPSIIPEIVEEKNIEEEQKTDEPEQPVAEDEEEDDLEIVIAGSGEAAPAKYLVIAVLYVDSIDEV